MCVGQVGEDAVVGIEVVRDAERDPVRPGLAGVDAQADILAAGAGFARAEVDQIVDFVMEIGGADFATIPGSPVGADFPGFDGFRLQRRVGADVVGGRKDELRYRSYTVGAWKALPAEVRSVKVSVTRHEAPSLGLQADAVRSAWLEMPDGSVLWPLALSQWS